VNTASTNRRPAAAMAVLAIAVGAAAAQPPARQPAQPPTTVTPRDGCVTAECHPGVKQYPHLHGPVHVNACDSCHSLADAAKHTFQDVRARSEMCGLCHIVEAPRGDRQHTPFAKGECLTCHDPHGSVEVAMLRGSRYADACNTCHHDITGAHDRIHGPVSAGSCGACHTPHSGHLPNLLIAEGRDLCLRCHISTGLLIESRPVVHPPVLGDCRVCHDPHATDDPAMLVKDPASLCIECHSEIAHTMDDASNKHGALTTKRACLNCHAPHASDHPRLLRMDEKTLCFECHNTTVTLGDGTTLQNMQLVLSKGKSLHGAIAQWTCHACHGIHGGEHRRLLNAAFPSEIYSTFQDSSYALCFTCHDRQMVQLPQTETVTAFRNGDQNLHYVHVHRDTKSRSCRICHDSHAANRERHIRDEIPFGPAGWMLPIGYIATPDGGGCAAGCHVALKYSRTSPVVYPAPDVAGGKWKGDDLVPGTRAPTPTTTSPPPPPPQSKPTSNPGKNRK
jgi:predicted CXXCH cytochrome family protein